MEPVLRAAVALPALPVPPYWLALAVCLVYAGALWRMDVYTPRDVRHWERLARLRGLEGSPALADRLGGKLPLLGRLREEVDIGMLLVIGGSRQTTESWLVGTAAWALAAAAVVAALGGLALSLSGQLAVPLWLLMVAIGVVVITRYVALRSRAFNRQARVGEQLADALLGLAVLVPGIPAEDALALLARCQRSPQLAGVLDGDNLERLLGEDARLQSTRERYQRVGQALRIPLFQELSQIMRGIEAEGLSPREEYPALSRISAENPLAQNRLRAARAKTGAAAAIALLLIPLLIMVGGGIAFAFLGAVNG
ncbi:MAG: hypothetical protein M3010_03750 [Candidatus Dormibacteraeota bacterium]|nr:hypothetical protein [Candidatus Dormibacteraeota bacterium]